jgi:hypothetical protein
MRQSLALPSISALLAMLLAGCGTSSTSHQAAPPQTS